MIPEWGRENAQEREGFPGVPFPPVFFGYASATTMSGPSLAFHAVLPARAADTRSERHNAPAIMISHSPSPSFPSGRNMFTSPTILHRLICSGDTTPRGAVATFSGRARRMNVSSGLSRIRARATATVSAPHPPKPRGHPHQHALSSSSCHFRCISYSSSRLNGSDAVSSSSSSDCIQPWYVCSSASVTARHTA